MFSTSYHHSFAELQSMASTTRKAIDQVHEQIIKQQQEHSKLLQIFKEQTEKSSIEKEFDNKPLVKKIDEIEESSQRLLKCAFILQGVMDQLMTRIALIAI